jgi:hypothetical protein
MTDSEKLTAIRLNCEMKVSLGAQPDATRAILDIIGPPDLTGGEWTLWCQNILTARWSRGPSGSKAKIEEFAARGNDAVGKCDHLPLRFIACPRGADSESAASAALRAGVAAAQAEATQRLALLRAQHARLVAAARATIAASRDGYQMPLIFLEHELARHGQLPGRDQSVPQLLAAGGARFT